LEVGRVGETERRTYEIYLRGTPKREGAAVGAATGCSTRSLSVIASKWMDLRGGFPLTNRSLESERAIRGKRRRGHRWDRALRSPFERDERDDGKERGERKGRRGGEGERRERDKSNDDDDTRTGASQLAFKLKKN
jgi:hypothetical protein